MEVYIITLLMIFVAGLIEINFNKSNLSIKLIFAVLFIIIVAQIGLRWETGTDWNTYLQNFENTNDILIVIANSLIGFEFGYGLLVYFFKFFSTTYSLFLLFHALFFYAIIFKTFKKYSPFLTISLLIYYASNLGIVGSNRQLIAIAICLTSIKFVLARNWKSFFSIVFIASLFHTSAILFSFYYFLNKTIKIKYLIGVIVFSFLVGKTNYPFLIFSEFGGIFGDLSNNKTQSYTTTAEYDLSILTLSWIGLAKRIIFIIVFKFFYFRIEKENKYYPILFNGYVLGLIIYLLFSSSLLVMVNRGSLYFNVVEGLLISSQFILIKNQLLKIGFLIIILIFSIILMYQSIAIYPDLFNPYKGLYYNFKLYRNMY